MVKYIKKYKGISLITIIAILGIWFGVTNLGLVNSVLIPTPQATFQAFCEVLVDYKGHSLLEHMLASLQRLGIAVLLSFLIATPLGLASGFFLTLRSALDPIIEFYRPLPPLAYYTILILALGIGDESKIALLFLAGFAPIYLACVSGVAKTNRDYIRSAYTLGANKFKVFTSVIFPCCLPEIFVGLRTSVGVIYTTLVAAEMVAATKGIGWMVLDAKNWLRSDIIFVGIIIMGLTGILIDYMLRFIEKKLVPWSGKV